MRFVDGLCDDIKSVIMVQRPSNLDTACSLALVQEEAILSRCGQRLESAGYRNLSKAADTVGYSYLSKGVDQSKTPLPEDKMSALRCFRRAKGLCERCVEKWSHGHKFGATAQLHAMDEVWNLFTDEEVPKPEEPQSEDQMEQLFMIVSYSAWSGTSYCHQTLKLQGSIQ